MTSRPRHIVITGHMAVGKSTAAEAVAASLGRNHRDSDSDIEDLTGHTGREIACRVGVPALHRLEAQVLLAALTTEEPLVISAAASTIEHPECRRRMAERAWVVVLTAPAETLQERAGRGSHRRNIPVDRLTALVAERADLFAEVADATISAEQPPQQVVDAIITAWDRCRHGAG